MDNGTKQALVEVKDQISDLATQVQKLTTSVDGRFSDVDGRFSEVSKQIQDLTSAVAAGFTQTTTKQDIENLETKISALGKRVDDVPDDIDSTYSESLNDLLERQVRLEKQVEASAA